MSNKYTEDRAIEFVLQNEKSQGRDAEDVRRDRTCSGYDVRSEGRRIEVKAATESWKTYTWIPLHRNSVECLKKYPQEFWLYIVRFVDRSSYELEDFYAIPGLDLIEGATTFKIREETYGLTPISRKSLLRHKQDK